MNNTVNGVEGIGFKDNAEMYHGLKGHVKILRKNKKTGEVSLWYENDNVNIGWQPGDSVSSELQELAKEIRKKI